MAQNKKPTPVVETKAKYSRGLDYSCPKSIKMLRGSMTKEVFRSMILNDKIATLSKKKIKKVD